MSGSFVLTAQTSTTGTMVSNECRVLAFTVAFTTAGDPTLSFRDTTATTGSTVAIYKWPAGTLRDHITLPEGGIRFTEGVTVSTAANLHSLTIYHQ